ncbi:hypothetical protein Fmac_028525 [Flemingia macrophylla]|uniref:Uncharacterized protein n=1 Tax=Flemingia macrophylla TaxID=520843 RepID=A0ABD1L7R8_9FABA
MMSLSLEVFMNVVTVTSAETRKLEDKLDAIVNLVTQLDANQKPASVARVCGIRSSNNHHTSVCPSSQKSGVDDHPQAFAANTYCRPPQQGVHDVATDTSAETRKLEGNLDALVSLVTQLATNHKPPYVVTVFGISSSNDHLDEHPDAYAVNTIADHDSNRGKALNREDGSQLLAVQCKKRSIVIRGVHDVATDTSAETRKLEGKLDALVNLVTQLVANQMSASVARVFGIRSSNDHHTSVCPSSQQTGVGEYPEAYVAHT